MCLTGSINVFIHVVSEWQSWLLFYSLPLLSGILPTPYYLHYCALVCAVAVLLGDNILEQDLEKAQVLLEEFYRHAALLYGLCSAHCVRPH